jgi:hypothetical protein
MKWLWVSRILLIATALGIMATSYFFYEPMNFSLSYVGPQVGQLITYGVPAAAVAAFAWFWPEAGGILAIMFGLFHLWQFESTPLVPLTLTPAPVFGILQGLFIGGGILSLIAGLLKKPTPYTLTVRDKRIQRTATIIAFTTIAVFVIAYIFIYPPLIFFAIPAFLIATIAWAWPTPGGILMLLISVPGFYPLTQQGWEILWKWPAYVLLTIFVISAVMHLVVAWKIRRLRLVRTTSLNQSLTVNR